MMKKIFLIRSLGFLAVFLYFLLTTHVPKVFALVCTSPKKGAATLYEDNPQVSQLGVSNFYRYSPYSTSYQETPMLKKVHIDKLRANPNPNNCAFPDSQALKVANECPARGIKKVVEARGRGGYWLILNEPDGEEDQFYQGGVGLMVDDIAFMISFIKQHDPEAKFIVAWYEGIREVWRNRAPNFGLDPDYKKVFTGWHLHFYHENTGLGNINTYFSRFKVDALAHPALIDKNNWGAQIWLTEFGTLMSPVCDNLSIQAGCECRFDRIDNDGQQLCVAFMEKLTNWLETDQSPFDRYFWWSYGRCDPANLGTNTGDRDLCFGALATKQGNNISLNKLGLAFAQIPNDNGVCKYGFSPTSTPRPTSTPGPGGPAISLNDGPHLLIDDYLIENSSGIERYARISNYPRTKILDGMESVENYQSGRKWKENAVSDWPVDVHYDPVSNQFRMWHETFLFDNHNCTGKNIIRTMVHRISTDGTHFSSPGTELNYDCKALAYAFSSVIDDKTGTDRYKTIYGPTDEYGNKRGNAPGMGAVSADGINWNFIGPVTQANYDEIWAPFWDPKYQKYGVLHRDYDPGTTRPRRYLRYGETDNFYSWPASSPAFDKETETGNFGDTEYYGASNTIRRGDYLIAVKRILRDDLKAEGIPDQINNRQWNDFYTDPKFPVYGIGYSVLAWSRDGEVDTNGNRVWHRDKPLQEYIKSSNILDGWGLYNDPNVFFAPDPNYDAFHVADPNDPYKDDFTSFDHAHAWINTLLEMPAGANGETLPMVYMYYGGYKYGHKIYTDRSLGFTKIKKDRFVSWREWENQGGSGYLETPWIKFDASSLALNLDTAAGGRIGSVKLEIIKQDGSLVNCGTFSGVDEINQEVTACNIAQFANQTVKFKFTISDAYLFAFYLDGEDEPPASPTPACLRRGEGNLNCDSLGLIDELDLAILLGSWGEEGKNEVGLNLLLSNWKTN